MIGKEKHGHVLVLVLFIVIITPKLSQLMLGSSIKVFGLTLNDSVLLLIAIITIILVLFMFIEKKPDLSFKSNKHFKQYYKPESDLNRLRQYIKEQRMHKESDAKIRHTLIKVGWYEEIIDNAFNTAETASIIKLVTKKIQKKN
jgi:hypothetical protein